MAGINITLGGNFSKLTELQKKSQSVSAKIKKGFSERIGHRMFDGVIASLSRIPGLMKKAVDAASDLEENAGKVGQVFRDQAAGIMAWSENASSAFGQSRNDALSAAGTFGNLFDAMGMTTGVSADMSTKLVELAADLASFNNTSVEDAIGAIGSALRGEAEPMRRYGVLLNEATLKAQALASGLHDGKGALDPATKALAAYGVILDKTAVAQGDFERTGDGLANSQRTIKAEFEDLSTSIGEKLLPNVQEFANYLKDLDFERTADQVKGLVDVFTGLGKAIAWAAPKTGAYKIGEFLGESGMFDGIDEAELDRRYAKFDAQDAARKAAAQKSPVETNGESTEEDPYFNPTAIAARKKALDDVKKKSGEELKQQREAGAAASKLITQQKEAAAARSEALSDFDAEIALIEAQAHGNEENIRALERQFQIRKDIKELKALGYSEDVARGRAEALAEATDRRDASGGGGSPGRAVVVDSLQRVGGGGGIAANPGLDYARRQTEGIMQMASTLTRIETQLGRRDME